MRDEPAVGRRWIEETREDGATVLYLQGAWRLPYLRAVVG
jgi:hypothetical protein